MSDSIEIKCKQCGTPWVPPNMGCPQCIKTSVDDNWESLPEIEKLRRNLNYWMDKCCKVEMKEIEGRKEITALKAEVKDYRKALEFYADKKEWHEFISSGNICGEQDGDFMYAFEKGEDTPWRTAKEVLAKHKKEGEA